MVGCSVVWKVVHLAALLAEDLAEQMAELKVVQTAAWTVGKWVVTLVGN